MKKQNTKRDTVCKLIESLNDQMLDRLTDLIRGESNLNQIASLVDFELSKTQYSSPEYDKIAAIQTLLMELRASMDADPSGKKSPKLNIFDLLKNAERMEQAVIRLPAEVKASLNAYQKSSLNMLTYQNVVALADWAAKYPDRWKTLKLHYLNPALTARDIALIVGISIKSVRRYLSMHNIDLVDYWDMGDSDDR